MSLKYKSKNSKLSKVLYVLSRVLILLFLAFLILTVYLLPKQHFFNAHVGDTYAKKIFPYITRIPNGIFSLFQNSVTELVIVAGIIPLIAFIIYVIVKLIIKIFKGGFWKYLYKVTAITLIITLVFGLIFQLMHGFNYKRTPMERVLKLTTMTNRSVEEVIPVYNWAFEEMKAARKDLNEDIYGVTHVQTNFDECVFYANILVNSASKYFDLDLSPNFVRAKPVSLSHYWSYTEIVGMYNPFFGEANVNVDCTSLVDFPSTLVHEILHAKGLARESDAELMAILMCCMSDRSDFRYCGFLEVYTRLHSILWEMGVKLPYDAGAARDMASRDKYWDSLFTSDLTIAVADVSNTANDTFLKTNDQEEGVKTYIIDNDYYIEFYYNFVDSENKDD